MLEALQNGSSRVMEEPKNGMALLGFRTRIAIRTVYIYGS